MEHCIPLYVMITLIFLSNVVVYYIQHDKFQKGLRESGLHDRNNVNNAKNIHHTIQVKAVIFYIVAGIIIYYTCVEGIYMNPSWIIVGFYGIWVLFELILMRFVMSLESMKHLHGKSIHQENGLIHNILSHTQSETHHPSEPETHHASEPETHHSIEADSQSESDMEEPKYGYPSE